MEFFDMKFDESFVANTNGNRSPECIKVHEWEINPKGCLGTTQVNSLSKMDTGKVNNSALKINSTRFK